jgi:GNAT superfamily N-acetyltransferase
MTSFWKNNPSVPSWSKFTESWFYSYPPKLLDLNTQLKNISSPYILRKATEDDIQQLPEFWSRWYSLPPTRCVVPLAHIQKMAAKKWDILVCVNKGEVIGTLVRRWIYGLHMREVTWQAADFVDYYCIHPAYRKKGLGRGLFNLLHNMTPKPMPHLVFWEGFQAAIPPICAGLYLSRRCTKSLNCVKRVYDYTCNDVDVWSDYTECDETSVWETASGRVVVWNTFHVSVPEGALIGIIMAGEVEAVNLFASSSGHDYGILLFPGHLSLEGWSTDSFYQWVAYNTQVGFISRKFPVLFM